MTLLWKNLSRIGSGIDKFAKLVGCFFGITAFHRFLSLNKDLSCALFLQTQEKIFSRHEFLRLRSFGIFWHYATEKVLLKFKFGSADH